MVGLLLVVLQQNPFFEIVPLLALLMVEVKVASLIPTLLMFT